ncbi:MAG: glycosyltransferase, partial [Acidobacteria bacterium]|nr:glycosyltransferase [Acidobacteriota bacterium]
TLLEAWAQVKEGSAGDVHLVLAGRPGDTAEPLQDLCRRQHLESSVHFIGLTNDVPGLLAASDISVFSSRLEGMSNAVLESMAAGLPVAATRIAGTEEALGADYPLLVQAGDAQGLANALRTLIGDEFLRLRLGERNQERARTEFSVTRLGQHYMDLLRPYL